MRTKTNEQKKNLLEFPSQETKEASHCRHVGVQNICMIIKIEVNSQRRTILLFMYTNMAAMTSHVSYQ